MQIPFEVTVLLSIAAVVIAIIMSAYLFSLWYRQENRLLTDLPLVFGIAFLSYTFNMIIQTVTQAGIVEASVSLFKLRTLSIGATILPLLAVLMHILLPRYKHHHRRVMVLAVAYWLGVTLLGGTEELIMALLIPIGIVVIIGLIITFTITWKTGRLKEVRSDLLVVTLFLLLFSQISKIPLMNIGIGFIADLITATGTITVALALANPWYKRESRHDEQTVGVTATTL
ncbi:MAG: hypothetical protein ACW97A_10005 [Candidatus Thorarchaeota archaeon]|jgi:hypothetical protein